MNQDKMHLINKIFNNETIRTVWDNEKEVSVGEFYELEVEDLLNEINKEIF